MADTKPTISSPFVGPNGAPVKVTKEERDELKLLGVSFGDDDAPAKADDEQGTDTNKEATR